MFRHTPRPYVTMRVMQWLLVVATACLACSSHDASLPAPAVRPAAAIAGDARPATSPTLPVPGVHLPDGATPLAYDLRLEVDPDRDTFRGTVVIRVRLDR